jgi:hypothetical protein
MRQVLDEPLATLHLLRVGQSPEVPEAGVAYNVLENHDERLKVFALKGCFRVGQESVEFGERFLGSDTLFYLFHLFSDAL